MRGHVILVAIFVTALWLRALLVLKGKALDWILLTAYTLSRTAFLSLFRLQGALAIRFYLCDPFLRTEAGGRVNAGHDGSSIR